MSKYDIMAEKKAADIRTRTSWNCDNASFDTNNPFGRCPVCRFEHRCKKL